MPAAVLEKEFLARLDSKKRVAMPRATHDVYKVKTYSNGRIVFTPYKTAASAEISKETISKIGLALKNMKAGKVSDPIDIDGVLKLYAE